MPCDATRSGLVSRVELVQSWPSAKPLILTPVIPLATAQGRRILHILEKLCSFALSGFVTSLDGPGRTVKSGTFRDSPGMLGLLVAPPSTVDSTVDGCGRKAGLDGVLAFWSRSAAFDAMLVEDIMVQP